MTDPHVDFDWDAVDPEVEPTEPDLPRAALDYLVHRLILDRVVGTYRGCDTCPHQIGMRLIGLLASAYRRPLLLRFGVRNLNQLADRLCVPRESIYWHVWRFKRNAMVE